MRRARFLLRMIPEERSHLIPCTDERCDSFRFRPFLISVERTCMNDFQRDQVAACEQSLLEAMVTSNAELLDELLHDDLLFNGPTGQTATKAMDLENHRSGNIQLDTVNSSDQTVSLIGDNAVVAVTVEIKGNYLGQVIDGKFRYLRVWKFVDGRWQVIGGGVVALSEASLRAERATKS
jgi:hypothetical protein